MVDNPHPFRRKWLGGLKDIGGELDHVKIKKTYGGDCGWKTLWRGTSLESLTAFWTPFSRTATTNTVARDAQERADTLLNQAYQVWRPNNSSLAEVVSYYQGTHAMRGWLTQSQLDVLGTTAIDRCKPNTPAIDLATTIAEFLADRSFFSIPGTADNLAGEYLNYSLAIQPTIADLHSLKYAMEHQDELIAQYERDAGRPIRRRYQILDDVYTAQHRWTPSSGKYLGADGYTVPSVNYYANPGYDTVTVTTTTRQWFSGTFTYSIPEEGWRRTLADLERVYGIEPYLDTGWEAIPFSFVVDYFADTGSVLRNMAAFWQDGLVMPYGYVMSYTTHKVEHEWSGLVNTTRGPNPTTQVSLVANYDIEVKQRRRATPFGFGFNMGGLTTRQKSILAALGIVFVL